MVGCSIYSVLCLKCFLFCVDRHFRLELFGSSATGAGLKDAGIDISFQDVRFSLLITEQYVSALALQYCKTGLLLLRLFPLWGIEIK